MKYLCCACFWLCISLGPTLLAQDPAWTSINPKLNARGLEHLRVIDQSFVAYGQHGRVISSPDGLAWTALNLPSNSTVVSLAYGDGLWVALGERGEVYRRSKHTPWTLNFPVNTAPNTGSVVLSKLAFGNGVFVRAGTWSSGDDYPARVSVDGLNWEPIGLPPDVAALNFTGSRFLAAADGYRGVDILTSTDGVQWEERFQSDDRGSIVHNFVQHGEIILLPGFRGIYRSIDGGETWTLDSARALARINVIDAVFYAEDLDSGAYLRSTDGVNWSVLAEQAPDTSLLGAAKHGATVVTLTSGDRPVLAVSTDAQNWIPLDEQILPLDRPPGLVAGNGIFNAAGGYISIDGLQWFANGFWPQDRGFPVDLQFCRDRFFYIERHSPSSDVGSTPLCVYTSIDGRTGQVIYTAETSGQHFGSPVFLNGTFYLPWSGGLLVSTDGTQWNNRPDESTPPALAGNGNVLARVGSYPTIYRKEEPMIEVSSDGLTWIPGYTFSPDSDPSGRRRTHWVQSIVSGGNRMAAAVITGDWHGNRWSSVVHSPDGIHWFETNQALEGNHALGFNDGWFTCVTRDLDTFVRFVTVINEGNRFHYSRDGAEWKTVPMHEAVPAYLATNGNVFLAASASGELWRATLGPRTPPTIVESLLESVILRRGDRTTLSVNVTGSGPFVYQWRRNGVPIVGADAPSLELRPDPKWPNARYDVVVSNELGSVRSSAADITFADSWLSNLSSLAFGGGASDPVVQGFVLGKDMEVSSDSRSVSILLRAVGSSLAEFGVNDPLADPRITLRPLEGDGRPEANDNWFTDDPWRGGPQFYLPQIFAQAGAFALPESSTDAAFMSVLAPGHYTLNVSDTTGRSGRVLTELYDYRYAESTVRLVNLSTRALTGPGNQTLIMGFVIAGTEPLRVLIRGIGPGLAEYLDDEPLSNPRITLHDATGREIHHNDTWHQARNADELRETMSLVGAFPLADDSNDAALLERLEPGVYTLMVHSQDGSEGIALGEIYAIPR